MLRYIFLNSLIFLPLLLLGQNKMSSHIEDLEFRAIGPAGMSGRVTSIDVDPQNKNRIAVGTASGGVWISDNGGVSWKPVFDSVPTQSIGAVAFDSRRSDIIWAGTGEGNPRNSHNSGKGLYKSLDGGSNWSLIGLEQTKLIHRIIIHPWNPDILYIAALGSAWGPNQERGVYKTTDGGKTFEKILFVNETTGCADLVIDPSNPDKLIAAMWDFERKPHTFRSGGPGSGLYITRDAGKTWQKVKAKQGIPEGTLGRMGLTISASHPNIIYALIEAKKNGLYKSTDGGKNWSLVNQKDIGNRPFYYADIFVDPQNPNTLYNLYSVLSKSTDGGRSFQVIGPYHKIHPDHHAFWIDRDNPNYIIEGNDGGLNISYDRGESWRFIRNLPLGQFYHVNVDDQFPYRIYGGMQDNGSWVGPSNVFKRGGIRSSDWKEILFGDGFDVLPQPSHPEFAYAMSQGGNVHHIHIPTGKSYKIKPVSKDSVRLRFNWNAPIAKDHFNAEGLFFGSQFVHYSADQGQSWERLSPDLTTNDPLKQKQAESGGLTIDATQAENYTTLTVIEASPFNSGTIWAGSDDGLLHLTTDRGRNWEELSALLPGLPDSAWFTQIRISPHNRDEVFVVANDYRNNNWAPYAYYTSDNGKSWTRLVDEKDVDGHCWSIIQDPEMEDLLFLGTEFGLYYSLDKGENWMKWKSFPSAPVLDMQIQEAESDLVIGTFGRSIFILDDLEPIRNIIRNRDQTESVFKILSATDGHLMEYRSFEGERFPGDAIFQGQTSTSRPMISLYISKEQDNKSDTTSEDQSDTTATDSISLQRPKKNEVKMLVLNSDRDTIRVTKRNVALGIERITWSMRRNGQHFPTRRKIDKKDPPPAGAEVLPGTYHIFLKYGDYKDSVSIKVLPDPRSEYLQDNSPEKLAQISKFEGTVIKPAFLLSEKLKKADQRLQVIKQVYSEQEEVRDSVNNLVKAMKDSIQQLKNELFGPSGQKGIDHVSEYLNDQLRDAYYLLRNAPASGSENAATAAGKANSAFREFQEKVDLFFDTDWQEFQDKIAQYPVELFNMNE